MKLKSMLKYLMIINNKKFNINNQNLNCIEEKYKKKVFLDLQYLKIKVF